MGVAYYIELDIDAAAGVADVDGKLLAAREADLSRLATSLGLPDLEEFFGASEALLEDFDIDPDLVPDAVIWFSPEEGLPQYTHGPGRPRSLRGGLDDRRGLDVVETREVFFQVFVAFGLDPVLRRPVSP